MPIRLIAGDSRYEMLIQDLTFAVATTCAFRYTAMRDRLLGRIGPRAAKPVAGVTDCRFRFPSGKNVLDAAFVAPSAQPVQAGLLICHGIGEVVDHWLPAQQLLAASGVASLVFDYSGYGESSGFVSSAQCEEDAVNAFHHLQGLVPSAPVSMLGFSMGSGVAAAVVGRVAPRLLVMCAAFTSFRKAAVSLGFPRALCLLAPPVWRTEETLGSCQVPVLLVHGEKDSVFPVQMTTVLHGCCDGFSELMIVPGLAHNEPFYQPRLSYWGPIISRLTNGSDGRAGAVARDSLQPEVGPDASAIHLS